MTGTRLTHCATDERMKRIIGHTKLLSDPKFKYKPPLWARPSGWLNLGFYMLKSNLFQYFGLPKFKRTNLTTEDEGLISIDWMDDEVSRGLPDDAPILIVLHTVTGSGHSLWDFMRDIPKHGWRACVFNRRGCAGMKLTSPKYSVLGSVTDTMQQVEEVRSQYPNATFIGMAGLSAGSGLVITYLGTLGDKAPVDAAVSLSPAYDIEVSFKGLHERYPRVDKSITQSMKKTWIHSHDNEEILKQHNSEALERLLNADSMHDFFALSSVFAGYKDYDHFCETNNPMRVFHNITCPTLILNAEDDPVCTKENIRHDLASETENFALIVTKTGSHVSFIEGPFGMQSWMTKVTMDFMSGAKIEKHSNTSTVTESGDVCVS